ncbi:MAG: tetratricopeptide repeat protein [Bacteroidota bacterium]
MAHKKKQEQESSFENVERALSRTEQYIEENQKSLTIIVLIIIGIVGAYLGYKRFYVTPRDAEAQQQMFVAEKYFEQDSFRLALEGDGQYPGFIQIIDDYGVTQSANLAHYYAGISNLHLQNYEEAIEHLEDFSSNDIMIAPIALGAIGDAYVELGDPGKAAGYYKKAAEKSKNDYTAPIYFMKAGQIFEELGKPKDALRMYQSIKEDYPQSAEGRQIDKYIARASASM